MANQYQSVDQTLVAINAAKKVTPQAKKPVPASLTTPAPIQPSLNLQTQQPQAISTNITPLVANIGGISSSFGAPNINSSPMLGGATPQEIGTTAKQLQSLPKQIPASGTAKKIDVNVIGSLGANVMAGEDLPTIRSKYPEFSNIDDEVLGSVLATMYDGVGPEEILQKFPELQGGQAQTPMQGGVKGSLASNGLNMGKGERVNPVGKVFEELNNLTSKIPVVQRGQIDKVMDKLTNGLWTKDGASPSENPNVLTMVANVPGSLAKTATGIARGLTNPLDTVVGLWNLATTKEGNNALKDRYGSLDNLMNTMEQDPVGVASDILTVVQGGAGLAGKAAGLAGKTGLATKLADVSKTAGGASNLGMDVIPQGLTKLAEKPGVVGKVATALNVPVAPLKTAKSIYEGTKPLIESSKEAYAKKVTGLSSKAIETVKTNPKRQEVEAGKLTEDSLMLKVGTEVSQISQRLSETGKSYEPIRQSKAIVDIGKGYDSVKQLLAKHNINVKPNGKLDFTDSAMNGSTADMNAIQNSFDVFKRGETTSDIFLNKRKQLSDATNWKSGVDTLTDTIVKGMRKELNAIGHKDIPGLKEIDGVYQPQVEQWNEVAKMLFDKTTGELKDSAKSKIMNSLGVNKEATLAKLQEIFPELELEVSALRTAREIDGLGGIKPGTYNKTALVIGGAKAGFEAGNKIFPGLGIPGAVVGAIGGFIATDPSYIINKIKGKDLKVPQEILDAIENKKAITAKQKTIVEDALKKVGVNDKQFKQYPMKLKEEGLQTKGATLPKPTPKTPPITVEKGAIGMGTPKPKVTPVIPPKATVAPVVPLKIPKAMPKLQPREHQDYIGEAKKIVKKNTPFVDKEQPMYIKAGITPSEIINGGFTKKAEDFAKKMLKDDVVTRSRVVDLIKAEASEFKTKQLKYINNILKEEGLNFMNAKRERVRELNQQFIKASNEKGDILAPKKGMPKLGKEIMEQNNLIQKRGGGKGNDIQIDLGKGLVTNDAIKLSQELKGIDNYVGKTKRYSNDILGSSITDIKVGDVLSSPKFISSANKVTKDRGKQYGKYEIIINSETGKDITKIKGKVFDVREPEVLFDRWTKFTVEKIDIPNNKVYLSEKIKPGK